VPDRPILLRADAVWTGDALERPGLVLMAGERLLEVSPGLSPPDGAQVLELPGCTLVPGLIDMHGHCRIDARLGPLAPQTRDEPARYVLQSLRNLQADLAAGVTTVKTNGDRDLLDVGLREALAEGLAEGPRLFVAGRGIKAPDCTAGVVATALVSGPDAVREAVEANLAAGADHIKIYVSGGLLEPVEEACRAYYSREEIRAAVRAAEAGGTYVSAHCAGGPTADWCAEEGVRVLEHGFYLSDEQLATLRRHGTWLDLTLGVAFHPDGHAAEAIRHGADASDMAQREAQARDSARRAIEQGNRILFGTDSMHGLLAWEALQAIGLGMRPVEALRRLTASAAEVIGASELGRLAPGRQADLVALRGDPLADPSSLERVELVVQRGRVVVDRREPGGA
jgi:imidazolonepropionase-like amidohydrolase